MQVAVIWFRNSLRIHDNPALSWACESESIDHIRLGGFKLGFWFGQQGSLLFFLLIIFIYYIIMNKLDERFKK